MQNNKIEISGRIVSDFIFDHEKYGEKFYLLKMESKRASGAIDNVLLMMSDRDIYIDEDLTNKYASITGEIRTHNYHSDDGVHLRVVIFVDELDVLGECPEDHIDINCVYLDGYICKQGDLRQTPKGRTICDIILAINRNIGRNDYIPCIFWNKNAKEISDKSIGSNLQINGRFQSRDYNKKINNELVTKTAYEISVQSVAVV